MAVSEVDIIKAHLLDGFKLSFNGGKGFNESETSYNHGFNSWVVRLHSSECSLVDSIYTVILKICSMKKFYYFLLVNIRSRFKGKVYGEGLW